MYRHRTENSVTSFCCAGKCFSIQSKSLRCSVSNGKSLELRKSKSNSLTIWRIWNESSHTGGDSTFHTTKQLNGELRGENLAPLMTTIAGLLNIFAIQSTTYYDIFAHIERNCISITWHFKLFLISADSIKWTPTTYVCLCAPSSHIYRVCRIFFSVDKLEETWISIDAY